MFQEAFNVQGVVPNNEAIVGTVLVTYGTNAALIFFFGMIVNVLLSMTSKFKYIYLSGHVAFYMAAMIAVIFKVAGFADWEAVLWGSIAQGLIVTVSPALVQPFMKRVTGTDDVALGHTGGAGIALSGRVATVTRSKKHPSKSTEDLDLPSGLGFLRDTTVITALSMGLIYLIVALFAGSGYIEDNLNDGTNYIVFALMQGATFCAGVFVIPAGVRVVLGEIVPAFKGISERLVKDAKPALDVPITFAPNALLIGFLSSFVGGLLGMGIMAMAGTTIVVPGVIAHFMTGGASGVIGNGVGGRRGAVLGAFVNGLAITFLPLWLLPVLGDVGLSDSTFSDADFGVAGLFLGYLNQGGGQTAIIIIGLVAAMLVTYAASFMIGRREKKVEVAGGAEEASAEPSETAT